MRPFFYLPVLLERPLVASSLGMKMRRPPVAMTIAGSDSSGGAGIQADLKTFMAHGVWGTTVVVAVTAQSSTGVRDVGVLPVSLVRAQLEALEADAPAGAVKTGMLGTVELLEVVVAYLREHLVAPLVVDPVLAASDGTPLLVAGRGEDLNAGIEAVRQKLLPLATLVTPNLNEAAALACVKPIRDRDGMEEAAQQLREMGANAVLVKGGHLVEDPDGSPDLFLDEQGTWWLEGPRIAKAHTHGTGCVLSAAITARLAKGEALREAVAGAKRFVTAAIDASVAFGDGSAADPGGIDVRA